MKHPKVFVPNHHPHRQGTGKQHPNLSAHRQHLKIAQVTVPNIILKSISLIVSTPSYILKDFIH